MRFTGRNTASSPRRAISPIQPLARVPSAAFKVGCTAMPAGLSSRAAWSSSYRMVSGMSCGSTVVGSSGGRAKRTVMPGCTRRSVNTGTPSAKKPLPRYFTALMRVALTC